MEYDPPVVIINATHSFVSLTNCKQTCIYSYKLTHMLKHKLLFRSNHRKYWNNKGNHVEWQTLPTGWTYKCMLSPSPTIIWKACSGKKHFFSITKLFQDHFSHQSLLCAHVPQNLPLVCSAINDDMSSTCCMTCMWQSLFLHKGHRKYDVKKAILKKKSKKCFTVETTCMQFCRGTGKAGKLISTNYFTAQ